MISMELVMNLANALRELARAVSLAADFEGVEGRVASIEVLGKGDGRDFYCQVPVEDVLHLVTTRLGANVAECRERVADLTRQVVEAAQKAADAGSAQ